MPVLYRPTVFGLPSVNFSASFSFCISVQISKFFFFFFLSLSHSVLLLSSCLPISFLLYDTYLRLFFPLYLCWPFYMCVSALLSPSQIISLFSCFDFISFIRPFALPVHLPLPWCQYKYVSIFLSTTFRSSIGRQSNRSTVTVSVYMALRNSTSSPVLRSWPSNKYHLINHIPLQNFTISQNAYSLSH
jgi:hypothetical protein